jgi:putative phosphoesterase
MKIGIVSDTHGLLRPEAIEKLAGSQHIIHAGDIGAAEIIPRLREIAPTTAIKGNIDTAEWARDYPDTARIEVAGKSIYVLHSLKDLDCDPAADGIDIVISGHSHKPRIETIDGVLYLNPGSAGPRRFKLPITVADLELTEDRIKPAIREL